MMQSNAQRGALTPPPPPAVSSANVWKRDGWLVVDVRKMLVYIHTHTPTMLDSKTLTVHLEFCCRCLCRSRGVINSLFLSDFYSCYTVCASKRGHFCLLPLSVSLGFIHNSLWTHQHWLLTFSVQFPVSLYIIIIHRCVITLVMNWSLL